MDGSNSASGISKILDEADTYEDRVKQITYFTPAESELWELVLNKMQPYFVNHGMIDNKYLFTQTAKVTTKFPEQKALVSRNETVNTLKTEVDSGFTSRKRAIKKLNPEMTDYEIESFIKEIDEEKTIYIPSGNEALENGDENSES
jgi:hypothetical protein